MNLIFLDAYIHILLTIASQCYACDDQDYATLAAYEERRLRAVAPALIE